MKKSLVAKLAFGLLALSYVGAGAYSYDAMGRRLNNAQDVNAPKIWRVQPEQVKTTVAEQFTQTGLYKEPDANTLPVGQDISFVPQKVKRLNATPIPSRKDTKMLVLGWGRYALVRHWDESHVNYYNIDEEELHRDWIAAIQELNWFFAAKEGVVNPNSAPDDKNVPHYLTQDEIKFHVFHVDGQSPVKDFPFGADGGVGRDDSRIKKAIQFALGVNSTVYMNQSYDDFAASHNIQNVITNSLDAGYPVIIREDNHVMMIDAYAITTRYVKWVRLLNPENHGSFQWRVLNTVDINMYVDYEKNVSVQYSDNDVLRDPEDDGLVNFDEKYRFKTANRGDTDQDYEWDKREIQTYVLLELPEVSTTKTSAVGADRLTSVGGGYVVGVKKEIWADVNKDGKRAELDRWERGYSAAGLLNGRRLPLYVENDVPGNFDIYALDILYLNGHSSCLNVTNAPSSTEKCSYATESKSASYAATVYQENEIASLYAKGNVRLGGSSVIRRLEQFSSPEIDPDYYKVGMNGSVLMYAKGTEAMWPWGVNVTWDSYTTGSADKIVRANESYTLTPSSNLKTLLVQANGTLIIQPGDIKLESLILESGSKVRFLHADQKTTIHVKDEFTWNTNLQVANEKEAKKLAKNFKVVYQGTRDIAIADNWAGIMFAPRVFLNLGSPNATLYGRFVGRVVSVRTSTTIKTVH